MNKEHLRLDMVVHTLNLTLGGKAKAEESWVLNDSGLHCETLSEKKEREREKKERKEEGKRGDRGREGRREERRREGRREEKRKEM
jgi:hypothetical protein